MPEMRSPLAVISARTWWAGFFAIVLGGAALSFVAYREGLPEALVGNGVDKVVHFVVGGLLAFFLDGALRRRMIFEGRSYALPLAAAAVLFPAGIEEWAQRFSSHRSSSIWDFAADCAGVFVGIALSRRVAQ